MARKPRYRQEREAHRIEIHRNVIERFLMDIKDVVRKNRKLVLHSILGLIGAAVIVTAGMIVANGVNARNERRFEKIMNEYARYAGSGDSDKIAGIIDELKNFTDTTYFGFAHSMAYYALGNIYYSRKEYRDARIYLVLYADKQPKTLLSSIALLKAAIALEEAKDLKGSLEIYRRLEQEYSDSLIADQIFYNCARVYGRMNDLFNSRNYYNKVISSFPDSVFVLQAKERLFMLGTPR
ncbi:MAG: hypothetical protein A2176_01935 [Spirochaetes bacterium RBG_13_51_14]|nr:MAG: hypothetical protein A2176_01935 [Spirochaetes bacterium RBG_13_51_14]